MNRSPDRKRPGVRPGALFVVIATMVLSLAIPVSGPTASAAPDAQSAAVPATGDFSLEVVDIPAHDGIDIRGIVTQPTTPGPHPLIVMPSSYALNYIQYSVPAVEWASEGFVVVSYTTRGFWESGGVVDLSGPPTRRDISTVIDWALANTSADGERVGALGISYGAGSSLVGAGEDPRIDAVVAMSGWTDLIESMYPNKTPGSWQDILLAAGELTGTLDPDLKKGVEDYLDGDVDKFLASASDPGRNPIAFIDEINANGVAVMMQIPTYDTFFPLSQHLTFIDQLTGPKRLLTAPGDHASPELPGLVGLPTDQWTEALDWMKRFVRDQETTSVLPNVTAVSADLDRTVTNGERFDDLGTDRRYHLTRPTSSWFSPVEGDLSTNSTSGWSHRIDAGRDTIADSGEPLVSGALRGYVALPPLVSKPFISRQRAAVWESPRMWNSRMIAGTPNLSLTVTPDRADTSFFVYLYEDLLTGGSALITQAPYTIRDAVPGQPIEIDMDLLPITWDLEPGSSVSVVIDTKDGRYQSRAEPGSHLTFSTGSTGAYLDLPLR